MFLQYVLESETAALKALQLCDRLGLSATATHLCRRLGMAAAQAGLVAVALKWMCRAHDQKACADLAAPLISKIQQQLRDRVRAD